MTFIAEAKKVGKASQHKLIDAVWVWIGGTPGTVEPVEVGFVVGDPFLNRLSGGFHGFQIPCNGQSLNIKRLTPLRFIDEPLEGYGIALARTRQKWNAALALAALHEPGIRIGYEGVAEGLDKVS